MSDRLQLDGVDLVFDDGSARSMDLILVECPTCDGRWLQCDDSNWILTETCPECEGAGWLLVEGAPISLEDLERMAPWGEDFETVASFDLSIKTGRPLESGELEALQRECFRIALGPGMG